jgi:dephospho-CoA kinase
MFVVGLTGGIGSGKSTVSALLADRGAVVVDADAITRELQQPGTPVFAAMVERFGPGIVAPDGTLDRAAVAAIVFNDPDALRDLNAIVHPAVGVEITRRMQDLSATDEVVILDVPLLVEAGASKRYPMDALLVVDVDPEVAVRRLVEQRQMGEADVRARMARQASREQRLAQADLVIRNDGSRQDLETQVDDVWRSILAGASGSGSGSGSASASGSESAAASGSSGADRRSGASEGQPDAWSNDGGRGT